MNKPQALKTGDKIGIVAPGAQFNKDRFNQGIETIKSWGLVPVVDKNLFKKDLIFAGTPEQRFEGLKKFVIDPDIKAIWSVRGGAGAYAVAPLFDNFKLPKAILKNPKPLIGLSDVTAIHLIWNQDFKWPSVHGPMVDRMGHETQTEIERKALHETLFNPKYKLNVGLGLKSLGKIITAGGVSGQLTGGNLTLLAASLGSTWELDARSKILFIEECGEPAYRIDRLFSQLMNAGKFDSIKALLLGDFTECFERNATELWPQALKRIFLKAKFPVVTGIRSGHGDLRLPLPFGCETQVSFKNSKPRVEFLESFVR